MGKLSIGELAKQVDLNPSAIRYYESIGLMPQSDRENGQRRFSIEVVDRLRFIKTAQMAGFQIDEIAVLL